MSQASANSRRLPYCGFQGTVRPLRVKETFGPVPTLPEGGCGGTDVVLAIPGRDGRFSAECLGVDAGGKDAP